jgi:hypothetical protein
VTRRQVRVTQQFFTCLDSLLPRSRDANGTPSTAEFLQYDLPPAIDRLAADFEGNTVPGPQPGTRVLIATGLLVPAFALYAHVAPDEAIDIYYLNID